MKTRPNIIENGIYRLDLPSKAFPNILQRKEAHCYLPLDKSVK